jgi:hypothetical protein
MILFDSNYLKIEFKNVPCRHLVAIWNGLPVGDLLENGCNTILQCCHENDIQKLLSDIRFREQLSERAEAFEEKAIASHASRHGRFFHAVVLSNEVFLKFGVTTFDRNLTGKEYEQQFFANQQDAVTWLDTADSQIP